jgi:hypothetical protein
LISEKKVYKDYSYLDIIYLPSYQYRLEAFVTTKCFDLVKKINNSEKTPKADINYNLSNFRSFINDAISKVIDDDVRNGNFKDYQMGDNLLRIRFTVNEKGEPGDYKQVTTWGDQFFYPVTSAMSMHARLPPSTVFQYLMITINRKEGSQLSYQYNFSRD